MPGQPIVLTMRVESMQVEDHSAYAEQTSLAISTPIPYGVNFDTSRRHILRDGTRVSTWVLETGHRSSLINIFHQHRGSLEIRLPANARYLHTGIVREADEQYPWRPTVAIVQAATRKHLGFMTKDSNLLIEELGQESVPPATYEDYSAGFERARLRLASQRQSGV